MRVSSHVNQQEQAKQQQAVKPCQIGKIVSFLHPKMLPFKKCSGLRRQPRWGLNAPRLPPVKHLHSPLATPLPDCRRLIKTDSRKHVKTRSLALDRQDRENDEGRWGS